MMNAGRSDGWRRASDCESHECVEVKIDDSDVLIRSTRDTEGPALRFSHAEWRIFCAAIVKGEFSA